VSEQGYGVAEATSAIGVSLNQVYLWKQQIEAQASGTALSLDERTELVKRRTENKRLQMEKDILKKHLPSPPRKLSQLCVRLY
jgi:transposase